MAHQQEHRMSGQTGTHGSFKRCQGHFTLRITRGNRLKGVLETVCINPNISLSPSPIPHR